MKVLFLNPHVGSDHSLVKALQAKGMAVLVAGNAQEAWQILSLHGANLDLAIIHREDATDQDNEGGFKFIDKIKGAGPQYADIPVIVTSHRWGDTDFARHQETANGANAYLKWPFDAAALNALILAVFGGSLPGADPTRTGSGAAPKPTARAAEPPGGATRVDLSVPKATSSKKPSPPSAPSAPPMVGSSELVLEDASNLFGRNDRQERSDTSIRLEMPEPDKEPDAPAPIAPPVLNPSSGGIELSGSDQAEPVLDLGGGLDIPIAENSGISLHALPMGTPSSALSSVLAQDASVEELLDAPAGTTVEEFDGRTTVQGNPKRAQVQPRFQQPPPEPEVSESEAAQDMPYLFQEGQQPRSRSSASVAFSLPLGDAVVPGGAAHAPDMETLKRYLLLREQDVAVLSTQLKAAKDQVKTTEEQLRMERGRNSELGHITGEQRRKLEEFEKEKQQAIDTLQSEIAEMRFQLKARTDKARILETQVREATEETERLKERVRADIRKIRVREKELENRLEIVKKDSEALISARENKIIELKRKLDLLEFNMDLLQDQHAREKDSAVKLRERLAKAAQVVRVAGGLLDNPSGASQLAAALASDEPGPSSGSEGAA